MKIKTMLAGMRLHHSEARVVGRMFLLPSMIVLRR